MDQPFVTPMKIIFDKELKLFCVLVFGTPIQKRNIIEIDTVIGRAVIKRINDLVYWIQQSLKKKMEVIHLDRWMVYRGNEESDRDDQN